MKCAVHFDRGATTFTGTETTGTAATETETTGTAAAETETTGAVTTGAETTGTAATATGIATDCWPPLRQRRGEATRNPVAAEIRRFLAPAGV